ncbi:Pre-mRNA-processing factor 39 [Merluccius polli]|uniref:Pre-mRNA-processing factor 39 n=1 Tax=Merluccius polli TaxID=89951 RepID=A0AA47MDW9_MERPO|nr:Pre-mRNA-processing factor 39 [Merluccius polli]
MASGRSCLLAKIRMMASLISRSLMMRCSSCLASSILSRSAQSTTNMRPCVPVTVSTLKPTVGMVVTDWPSFSLYRMVVLPAASTAPSLSAAAAAAAEAEAVLPEKVRTQITRHFLPAAHARRRYYDDAICPPAQAHNQTSESWGKKKKKNLNHTDEPMTGSLDTDSSSSGDSHAMEGADNGFLPNLLVLPPTGEWSLDPVPPEPDTQNTVLPGDSDLSQDSPGPPQQQQEHHSPGLASVEKAVEQFQLANAQLFQEEQPPLPTEAAPESPVVESPVVEPAAAPDETTQQIQEMPGEATEQDGSQGVTEATPMSEDGMELEEASKEALQEPTIPPEPEVPSEFEKLFKGCEENPDDFNSWVYLLQYVEQENGLLVVRKAFDAFFLHYPYCYGYWKKYADIEKKHEHIQVAEEVYRRGLQAIPLSVDLWLHYLSFIKENADPADPETEGRIRSAYEHAVLAAGTDFRSDRLWEAYINWETEQQKLANVTNVYDRILGIPTQLYSQHFQRFKEHVQNNNPKHFLSEEEFIQLRVELSKANMPTVASEDDETPAAAAEEEALPPGMEDLPDPAKRVTEIENMRHKVIETRQEYFNHNEHEVSKRWAFEEAIKRPYFHVKSLEKTQLNNWKEYLDFEMENGTPERVVVLFERCLIACALYEEFWTKYAKYLEGVSIEGVRHVYKKACTIHLPKKPSIHLLAAAYEEQQGNVEEARGILKTLEESLPSLAMVRLRRVSLERRHGNLEEAETLLREAMASAKNASETSFYAVKLARQLMKVQKSLGKARKVLLEAIEKDETSPRLYLNLLELEYSGDVQENEKDILACFDKALNSSLPPESRLLFSQRKVEFLEDFGSDINVLVAAYEEQQTLKKETESSKRKAENGSQESDAKRQRVEENSTAGTAGQDMTANSAYNYNSWYQQQYSNWGQNNWGQYNQYAQYSQYYPPPPT